MCLTLFNLATTEFVRGVLSVSSSSKSCGGPLIVRSISIGISSSLTADSESTVVAAIDCRRSFIIFVLFATASCE